MAAGLVLSENENPSRYLQEDGFGDFWIQWAMLSDSARMLAYENALLKNVNENSIVADVGAGSGFLSAMALAAGAKKVIAIEETQIAQKIVPLLQELKLPIQKEKLTVLNKNSFDANFKDSVSLVVSELFGNDPFQEGVISTLRNFAKKFKTQPTYIPLKVSVYFELVDIIQHPIKHRVKSFLSSDKLSKNQNTYFSQSFLKAAKKLFSFQDISFPIAFSKGDFNRVANPIELGSLPLNPPLSYPDSKKHPLFGKQKVKVTEEGGCVVGLIWYRVHLTNTITISSHPQEKDAAEHWSPLLILMNKNLLKNNELNITYKLNELETQFECSVFEGQTKLGGR